MGNKCTPEIRFAGFTDAWEQRKLEEIFNVLDGDRGKNYPGESDFYENGATLFLDTGNVKKNGFDFSTKKYITREKDESLRSGKLELHDFVLTSRGTLGNVAYYDEKTKNNNPSVRINSAMLILRPVMNNQVSEVYMATVLRGNTIDTFFSTNHVGSAQPHITKRDLIKVSVGIPSTIEEQSQIGTFFKQIDRLITLHQRKSNTVKKLKAGLLQKMFPKNGEDFPEIRFPGFTDAWGQRKLGELGSVAMNKRIFKEQTAESGEVPFYKIGTFGGDPDAYISRDLFEEYKAKYPYPEAGDILISASGSIGRTIEYTGKDEYFQDSNIVWLKHDERLDNSFLKQFYTIVKWKGLEGSTIKRLYNKNILDTKISVPSLAEQKNIGQFFNRLDNLITLHQRELEALKETKKAFLQKMFV